MIYKALGWRQPEFSHVSLILAPDKSKLSKRHGATSLGEFREQGFLPQAMLNFLALLGWNDGTEQEIFSLQDLQVFAAPSVCTVLDMRTMQLSNITFRWMACFSQHSLTICSACYRHPVHGCSLQAVNEVSKMLHAPP